MWQLLIHAKTFARIEDALKPFSDRLTPLVLSDDGDLTHPWGESEAKVAIAFGTSDAYFSSAAIVFFKTVLAFEQLDWFQSAAAGTEHPMIQAVGKKAGLFSGSHEQSEAIAEWVLWAGLDYFQDGRARRQAQAAKTWTRMPSREIGRSNWLIYGFGAIGQACGRRLRALGAHVIGIRRTPAVSDAADKVVTPDAALEMLPDADVVLFSMPLTHATESTADAAFFSRMKPGSLFLNVGRGGLVDEAALLDGLNAGRPAQAYLDVVREEPLSADSPIWTHPKIVLTPHISALTEGSKLRNDQIFLDNLALFFSQEPLRNAVESEVFS